MPLRSGDKWLISAAALTQAKMDLMGVSRLEMFFFVVSKASERKEILQPLLQEVRRKKLKMQRSPSSWLLLTVVWSLLTITLGEIFPSPPGENQPSYWYNLAKEDIEEAVRKPVINKVAKNVILFLGDGMGITVGTAGRIMKGQKQGRSGEEGYLVWDRFPNVGLIKTYNIDKQVADSAATSTAYLAGVKANYHTLGVTSDVQKDDCFASLDPKNRLDTMLKWAQDAGKDTGFITTAQVTHATPAGLYSKSASRYWYCDTIMMEQNVTACKDIARQLVEDEPGKNVKVILAGGRQAMGAPALKKARNKCSRSDGRNLVREWMEEKQQRGNTAAYVTSTGEMRNVSLNTTDYLMGLFAEHHLNSVLERDESLQGIPSITEMTTTAVKKLSMSDKGFFLMVESAEIDLALHDGQPARGLEEVLAFDEAVEAVLKMVDLEETLVIVTADHSHVMTMNGYPPRGNNILGKVDYYRHETDGLPYTTLMYTVGPGYNYTWNGEKVVRQNLTDVDTTDKDYISLAAVPTVEGEAAHGGEDVAAFATGPMAHLFHRVHEQTYVAHVMAYAACVGPYKDCDRETERKEMNETEERGLQQEEEMGMLNDEPRAKPVKMDYSKDSYDVYGADASRNSAVCLSVLGFLLVHYFITL